MPNDFAIRSTASGLGHPFPSSRVAMRRALSLTFAAYSSRLNPDKSRNSRILPPSFACSLDTYQVSGIETANKMISKIIKYDPRCHNAYEIDTPDRQ
jgi:hypothetical protein